MSKMEAAQVVELLMPFAEAKGPSFIKYDESEKCKDAKVLKDAMKDQQPIMKVIALLKAHKDLAPMG